MARVLRRLRIQEISSVDRGAGEGVRVLLMKRHSDDEPYWKREFSQEERDRAADSGAAMPDGSFPIKNRSDLSNAIRAIGRAKNPAKAKAHIRSRAKALGLTDMLPDSWSKRDLDIQPIIDDALEAGVDESALTEATKRLRKQIEESRDDEQDSAGALADIIDEFADEVHKLKEQTMAIDQKAIDEAVTKAVGPIQTALDAALAKISELSMSSEHRAHYDKLDDAGKAEFRKLDTKARDAEVKKASEKDTSDPVAKALIAANDTISALNKRIASLEGDKTADSFAKRAVDLGLKAEDGDTLRKAYDGDPEAQKTLDTIIKKLGDALKGALKQARAFDELGTQRGADGADGAYGQLMAKANELMAKGEKAASGKPLTKAQAFTKVYEDPHNADLVRQHKDEQERKRVAMAAGQL